MSYEVGSGQLIEGLDEAVRGLAAEERSPSRPRCSRARTPASTADVTVTVRASRRRSSGAGRRVRHDRQRVRHPGRAADDVRTRLTRAQARAGRAGPRQARRDLHRHRRGAASRSALHRRSHARHHTLAQQLEQVGVTREYYLEQRGQDPRGVHRRGSAKAPTEAMKSQFLLDALAEKEELTVEQEELTRHIVRRASAVRDDPA